MHRFRFRRYCYVEGWITNRWICLMVELALWGSVANYPIWLRTHLMPVLPFIHLLGMQTGLDRLDQPSLDNTDPHKTYRLNEPNGVPWTSNATLHAVLIWMQAKLSCLDIQSNVVCYVRLHASQIELLGRPEQRSMLRSFGRKPN